jgi:hypothetical protein
MNMKVKDLIAYLNTLPENATVEGVVDGVCVWEYLDVNDEQHAYYSSIENALYFGNID